MGQVMAHSFVAELDSIQQAKIAKEMPPEMKAKAEEMKEKHEDKKEEDKEASAPSDASAFDTLAAQNAVKIAHEAGFDAEEAAQRVSAVFTLGQVPESTKIAHIEDPSAAQHVRSLEILEAASYPVNWEEIYG